jgi:hypothetical protein
MKKQSLILVLSVMILAVFVNSCEDPADPIGPTLQFFGGEFIDADVTVEPGAMLAFSLLGTKGDANLASLDIQIDGLHPTGYPMTDIDKDSYKDTIYLEADEDENAYVYLFILSDKDGLADSASFTITVEKTFDPIDTWEDLVLQVASSGGNNENACASIDGSVFSYNDGTADEELQAKADFVYYYLGGNASDAGTDGRAIISAPSAVSSIINGGFADWTTKNVTEFYEITLSGDDFDAMTDDEMILEYVTGDPIAGNSVEGLETGDVVGFMTSTGKKGAFKVTELLPGWGVSQTITIDIKVQQ